MKDNFSWEGKGKRRKEGLFLAFDRFPFDNRITFHDFRIKGFHQIYIINFIKLAVKISLRSFGCELSWISISGVRSSLT